MVANVCLTLVNLNYNGNELTAVKKLVITDIESVRVDFTPAGGKYSMNMENEPAVKSPGVSGMKLTRSESSTRPSSPSLAG